jgi:glycosyltransferase involved in cell wall biosynthesis
LLYSRLQKGRASFIFSLMKILHIVTLSEWGGAQHIVYLLAKYLRSEHDISVACAPGGLLVERLRELGIRVVEIPELCRMPHPLKDLRALWKLYRLIQAEQFDIVHTHSTKAGLLGRLAARLANVSMILFTAHGWAFSEGRPWLWRWLLAQTERMPALFSTKIICVSEHDRQLALKFGVAPQEKLTVIYNGLDPSPFASLTDRNELRRELELSPSERIITTVGRLAPPKDLETLLAACERLEYPSWRLLILGDGPLRSRVARAIRTKGLRNYVTLLGERRDVPRFLKASDIFVLSSRWEGLPLVVIEAMLAGLPVVATRVGGIPELVEDGVTGLLVPPQDPRALHRALAQLLSDPELCERLGNSGQRRALERFTVERMIAQVRALYRALESARSSG